MKCMESFARSLLPCITFVFCGSNAWAQDDSRICKLARELFAHKLVDLTHPFEPGIPHWKSFPNEQRETLFTYEKDGFLTQRFNFVGQWGTHVDAPSHFLEGGRTVDRIPLKEMMLNLIVIDCSPQTAENPDYVLRESDIRDWEKRFGPIPMRSFVAMRTDWSKRWPDQAKMQNLDSKGVAHYPGWSLKALQLLIEGRGVTAIGHETTDTDPGIKTSKGTFECESYVLKNSRWQIELMTNLDQVSNRGAMILCVFPKAKDASGFPARVFAITE